MRVKFPALPIDPAQPYNILDIRNRATNAAFVRLSVTSQGNLRTFYNGANDIAQGAPVQPAFSTNYTTIGIHFVNGRVATTSDVNGFSIVSADTTAAVVDTTGNLYDVRISGDTVGGQFPSTGGVFDWFTLKGTSPFSIEFLTSL